MEELLIYIIIGSVVSVAYGMWEFPKTTPTEHAIIAIVWPFVVVFGIYGAVLGKVVRYLEKRG